MLFKKKIQRSCDYCAYSTKLDGEQVLCAKKGVVTCESCRKFRYDPTKRIPLKAKALDFEKYDEADFVL
ncbi:MAG: hypothetical protein IJZ15_03075 [Oscillospiraceae bacterium]|nr:hypothetical protein [Oscillospiraceae bacterium]